MLGAAHYSHYHANDHADTRHKTRRAVVYRTAVPSNEAIKSKGLHPHTMHVQANNEQPLRPRPKMSRHPIRQRKAVALAHDPDTMWMVFTQHHPHAMLVAEAEILELEQPPRHAQLHVCLQQLRQVVPTYRPREAGEGHGDDTAAQSAALII